MLNPLIKSTIILNDDKLTKIIVIYPFNNINIDKNCLYNFEIYGENGFFLHKKISISI